MKFHRKEKGFTLIELLVVVSIIGVLSSIVLSSLNTARSRARDVRKISELRSLQTALEIYHLDNNAYPSGISSAGCNFPLRLSVLVDEGYLPALPSDTNSVPFCFNYYGGDNPSGFRCEGLLRSDHQYAIFFSLENENENVDSVTVPTNTFTHCILGPMK